MAEEKWIVKGFEFSTNEDFIKARKESEAVAYIRANTQFQDIKKVLKLYNKLIDKNTFETVIGQEFLLQLRRLIIKNGLLKEEELRSIPVKGQKDKIVLEKDQVKTLKELEKYKNLYEEIKGKKSSAKVIIAFLIIIIISMTIIVATSDKTEMINYEEKIINQYEQWQHKLEEKEQQLNEREKAMEE